jgi:hypothetical protein
MNSLRPTLFARAQKHQAQRARGADRMTSAPHHSSQRQVTSSTVRPGNRMLSFMGARQRG